MGVLLFERQRNFRAIQYSAINYNYLSNYIIIQFIRRITRENNSQLKSFNRVEHCTPNDLVILTLGCIHRHTQ